MGDVQTTTSCPSCGVAVAIGYPRCPKCQTAMPIRRSKRQTFRDELLGGGTALPEDAGGAVGWILAGVILAVGVGAAIYFATRPEHRPAASDDAAASDEAAADEPERAAPSGEPADDEPVAPRRRADPGPTRRELAAAAVARVDEGLRVQRLWAKVDGEGRVLVIESSLCAEPGVMQVITAEGDALREAGFATVRCQEPNGKIDFESAL